MVVEAAAAGAGAAAGGLSFGEMAGLAGLSGAMNFGMGNYTTNQANNMSQANSIRQFIMQDYFMNKQNEYNKPVNQVKRLREANLNPALVYGNGGVSNTSAGPSGGNQAQTFKNNASFDFLGKLSMALGMNKAAADIDKLNMETESMGLANDIALANFGLKASLTAAQIDYLSKGTALRENELGYLTSIDSALQKIFQHIGAEDADATGATKFVKNIGIPLLMMVGRGSMRGARSMIGK